MERIVLNQLVELDVLVKDLYAKEVFMLSLNPVN